MVNIINSKVKVEIGLFQKKKTNRGKREGGLRIWNFRVYQRKSMWNFLGLIKSEVEFPGVAKKK